MDTNTATATAEQIGTSTVIITSRAGYQQTIAAADFGQHIMSVFGLSARALSDGTIRHGRRIVARFAQASA